MVILFPIFTYLYFSLLVTTCPAVYTKVGCFRDDMSNPRPLPELLFTDRDPSVKKYSNIPVDWQKWDSYLKDLVCRCAKEAKVRNYQFFSIQFYGKLNLKAISKGIPCGKTVQFRYLGNRARYRLIELDVSTGLDEQSTPGNRT